MMTLRLREHAKWMTILLAMTAFGCRPTTIQPMTSTKDLSFDRNAKNVAVIFGSPNDLTGIDSDVQMMAQMVGHGEGLYGFDIRTKYPASKADIMDMTAQAAAAVDANGTLFWYFSGHGAENGLLMGQPGMVDFDEVSQAIKSARSTPLKRLIVMIDSCYSGQMVDGRLAIGRNDMNLTGSTEVYEFTPTKAEQVYINEINYGDASRSAEREALVSLSDDMVDATANKLLGASLAGGFGLQSSKLMEQLLVVSAASRDNTSLAGSNGSTFTRGVAQAFNALKQNNGATIKEFIDLTTTNTRRNSGGHHYPRFKAYPENILSEKLVGAADGNVQNGNTVNNNVVNPVEPATDIYLKLGKVDANSKFDLYVSGAATLSAAYLCEGSESTCRATPTSIATLQKTTGIAGRSVFKAAASAVQALKADTDYTLIGVGADGNVKSTKRLKFSRR